MAEKGKRAAAVVLEPLTKRGTQLAREFGLVWRALRKGKPLFCGVDCVFVESENGQHQRWVPIGRGPKNAPFRVLGGDL